MKALLVVLSAVALSTAVYRAEVGGNGSGSATEELPRTARPKPPASYRVPKAAVRVSNSAELGAALAKSSRRNVVLAPGIYDSTRLFSNRHGHRVFAAKMGRSILRAGMSIGANSGGQGAIVRGIVFDVRDRAKTLNGAVVAVWGTASNTKVLDVTLRGNRAVAAGIVVRQPEGFVAQRIIAREFTDYGILVDANDLDRNLLASPFLLTDLDVANVARPVPRSSNGRAEACVWIGNTGTVRRVKVRDCAWAGMWTGTATRQGLVEDVDIDRTRTGIYIEHFTHDSIFQRILVRSRVRIGVVAEWADPGWGGRPASVDNVIQDSRFESHTCGVYLDQGTTRTTVRRSWFRRQTWAAIGDYRGNGNRFYDNDFSGIRPSAVAVSHDHASEARK